MTGDTGTYDDAVAGLSTDEVDELRRGFNRVRDALTAYPDGVALDGRKVQLDYVGTADVRRYLAEHHRLSPPPDAFISRTLHLLAAVGAVESHGGKYSLRDYAAADEAALDDVLRRGRNYPMRI